MAMLAETRQRKRYLLTPRGKPLYDDDSLFGTKMLKKMGWSKGKGLGANQNGCKDFVRVRMRNNFEGLGYENRDDHWTQHEQDFSGFLKTLIADNDEVKESGPNDDEVPRVGFGFDVATKIPTAVKLKDEISGISIEEKSKMSKARVHYRKFTKGKDIAQYSEKDLANIFGKKVVETEQDNGVYELLTQINWPQAEKKATTNCDEVKAVKSNFAGVQTVSTGLSVTDYFKQKMEAMKSKQKQQNNGNFEKAQEEIVEDCEAVKSKKKIKKRKQLELHHKVETNDNLEDTIVVQEKDKEEKHKRKKLDTEATELSMQAEPAFEYNNEKKRKKRNALEAVENPQKENAQKPKKEKKCKKGAIESSDVISPAREQNDLDAEERRKKSKKDKRNKVPLDNEFVKPKHDENKNETRVKEDSMKGDKEQSNKSDVCSEDKLKESFVAQQSSKVNKSKKSGVVRAAETSQRTSTNNESVEEYNQKEPKKKKKQFNKEDDEQKFDASDVVAADQVEDNLGAQAKKTIPAQVQSQEIYQNYDIHASQALKTKRKKDKKPTTNDEINLVTENAAGVACIDDADDIKPTAIEQKNDKNASSNSKSSKQKTSKDVGEATTSTKMLTLDELNATYNSYNVYTISSFCAEKFRNVDLESFKGATLSHLPGYSHNATDLQLKIEIMPNDERRITDLWNCRLNKYQQANPKAVFYQYQRNMVNAYKAKEKRLPRLHMKMFKRKRIFQSL
ncbi:uncharacterized protein DDB_G0286299 isoform X2 [Eurosta solidaginis]|uniref:uncharacterized protein DDB_G0286299 isoform X2 n=1 Tax=Eurosta solidaginis TaxID=178769 RepID=UPI003530CFE3